ncbi:hypothetical protein FB451DRAFT_515276 [Mycena latifolia]|nr:hypothetical protein FB451DRAFT_515276 [Mycena latifolia]
MPSYVVTGAARGIGFEFVKQLSADSGNTVFALVRNKATATKLESLPGNNITVLEADVTDAKALELAASEVSKATGGKLDCLINNAALLSQAGFTLDAFPTPEAVEKDMVDKFRVNTVGVVHSINAFLPLLRKGSVKKVVSISSGLGDIELAVWTEGEPAYSISKAAMNMVSAKYAAQFRDEGFTFLAICPGVVDTRVGPLSTEAVEEFKRVSKGIAKIAPDFKGPISPEESVKMQLEVINRWTVEETGAYVSHFGNKQWV